MNLPALLFRQSGVESPGETWYSDVQVLSDFLQVSSKRRVFIWLCKLVASAILKSRIDEELENERRVVIYGFNLVVVSYSQRVL